jgi:outer membrane protein TolC
MKNIPFFLHFLKHWKSWSGFSASFFRTCLLSVLGSGITVMVMAGEHELTLDQTIGLACDSSLSAHRVRNTFLSEYWSYRAYKAARLPSLSLSMTPISYDRTFKTRYDSETNRDVYRQQQSLYSYGNLALSQNVDLTGGTFYFDSELGFVRNFGLTTYQQFSTVPFRVGYSQQLLGYNAFKWEKQVKPLKYEKAKRTLLYGMEEISETAATYFFNLAMAQMSYDLARTSLASSDTLYRIIGQERQQIASISQADLLTLRLDWINAGNTLRNAEMDLKKASFTLANFLNLDKQTMLRLNLPEKPQDIEIDMELALQMVRRYNPDYLENRQTLLEAEQNLEKTRRTSRFEASLDLSVGFNQVASEFKDSYRNALEQDVVSVSMTVPLVDWGVRKGKVNMAKNQLEVTRLSVQQDELSLEEEVAMTVNDFNVQQGLIQSAEEARSLADLAYDATKERYLIGKVEISSMTLALSRKESARRNYISALKNYWLSYLKLRKLTLYDFQKNRPLYLDFEDRYAFP